MPKDIKTNVVIGVQTKGIDEASQKTAKFNKGLTESIKEQAKGFAEAEKHIQKLSRETERASNKAVRATKQVTEAVKKKTAAEKEAERVARRAIREAEREVSRVARQARQQTERDDQQRRGAFKQGLAQGGLPMPAAFMQRGPGMGRQMAGMAVGRVARGAMGVGGGVASAMTTGIGGVQQALSAIPLIGGAAAGMVGAAAGYSQQYIQLQKQRIGMAPYLLSSMDRRRAAQKNAKLKNWEEAQTELQGLEDEYRYSRYNREQDLGGNIRLAALTAQEMEAGNKKYPNMFAPGDIKAAAGAEKSEALLMAKINKQKAVASKARPKGGGGLGLGSIKGLGLNLMGVSQMEAEQAAISIVQAGGGRLGEAKEQDMIRTGFAAKTMFGVQEGVSGAFLKGGRRGGLQGARGEAGRAMTEAIQDGLRLGLEGSEINTYLQNIAAGIQQFEMTGIPVAKDSIAGMSQAFAVAGIAGTRAAKLGAGLTGYAQTIGQRGIKSSMDLFLTQQLGGFKGGGAKGLQDAFIQMEQMTGDIEGKGASEWDMESKISGVMREAMRRYGGGTTGDMGLRKALAGMGVTMAHGEMRTLGKRLRGEKLDPEEQLAADIETSRRINGETSADIIGKKDKEGRIIGLASEARMTVARLGPSAKAQAAIQNKELALGRSMTPAVQSLQRAALTTNKAFTDLVDGPLKNFGKWMEKLTKTLSEIMGAGKKGTLTPGGVVGKIIELG